MIDRAMLVAKTLYRMGDPDGAIWTHDEVILQLQNGYQEVAQKTSIFWDVAYLENLPRGFSCTARWELRMLAGILPAGFDYGVANYTYADEREMLGSQMDRIGPGNHTSPFEATDGWLSSVGADTSIPATSEVPDDLTSLERALWDNRGIDALSPRLMQGVDSRYEITKGEVYGFMWQKDGIRTLRKVRVPGAQASTATVNGSWGAMRRVNDLTGDTVTGTWGVPRRLTGLHPMGPEHFGAPRRPFFEGRNVRIEFARQGRPLDDDAALCELPERYALYLRDYAQSKLYARKGPGQDLKLAQHFDLRWQRDLGRIAHRMDRVQNQRLPVLGGDGNSLTTRPPRPSLPWAYGTVVR